ncbi:DUF4097 family beta strand repeat-containing protein [Acholeplasma hippikon]|uniref:DUF4097 domain-containing protein n=1 Tax=Acholeplasma hippikon TaxID=264636 RepID=A0A449BIY5_9MOLU|nr:DUF4097 family beta strand repeat-containing protein [Acholeplasma hippikon]VEU82431.1 Uncharacterised protein [Acholeplasma hippikon]
MIKKLFMFILLIGALFITVGIISAGGNIKKFLEEFSSDDDFVYGEKIGSEEVLAIDVDLQSANLVIHQYDKAGYKVDYYESEYNTKNVTYDDGKLYIKNEVKPRLKWFKFNMNSRTLNTINLYIPEGFNGFANIQTLSGNVTIDSFNFDKLVIDVTSGNIKVSNLDVLTDTKLTTTSGNISVSTLKTTSLEVKATSGKLNLSQIETEAELKITTTSGDIQLNDSKTPSLVARASSGNIHIIDVDTDSIKASLSSGNAKIKVFGYIEDYQIDAETSSGNVYFQGRKINGSIISTKGPKILKVNCSSGNIRID